MIDRKDLVVGLQTSCGKVVTAIGKTMVIYSTNKDEDYKNYKSIDDFCSKYSIDLKTVEVVRWANVDDMGCIETYITKVDAELDTQIGDIAVAVELRGSYEN